MNDRVKACVLACLSCVALVTEFSVARFGFRAGPAPTVMLIGAADQRVQAWIYTSDSCTPCRRYVAAVRAEMPRDGWTVRDATAKDVGSAHVVISQAHAPREKIEVLPTTILRRDGVEVDRIVGRITPTELADRINNIRRQ